MDRQDKKAATPAAAESNSGTGPVASGTLFGVGVGPGDPGLVTLAAADVIRRVPTTAYPVHKEGASSRALETVRDLLRPGTTLLPLLMPMTKDSRRLDQAHAAAAAELVKAAAGGRDVAYLSLGDPLFYSTFGYLAERFHGPVEVISGVSAISATAAAVGQPLAAGDMPTVVVTGRDHGALARALEMDASVVILKPRSLSSRSLDLIGSTCGWERTCAAIELGRSKQRIVAPLDPEHAAALPYFAVLWIRPAAEREGRTPPQNASMEPGRKDATASEPEEAGK